VRLMHGEIVFRSTPGEGTRIEVSVPLAAHQTAPPEPEAHLSELPVSVAGRRSTLAP
jgi:hypothetical protein